MDKRDVHLLAELESDGRLTGEQLSLKVPLSASQCSRRKAALEEKGLILGYRALLDARQLGLHLVVFMSVTLKNHDRDIVDRFADLVAQTPQIQEAYMLTGTADYLLKIVARDIDHLHAIINNRLLPSGTIERIASNIALSRLKEFGSLAKSAADSDDISR